MSTTVLFTLYQMSVALGGLSASVTLLVLGLSKDDNRLKIRALIVFFSTSGALILLSTLSFFISFY